MYPPIALAAVNALEQILANYKEEGRNYLEKSPYSPEIKAKLMVLAFALTLQEKRKTEDKNNPLGEIDVSAEMDKLYRNLKDFSLDDEGLAATEKIAILRVQTNLLEKIIEMRERAMGVDQYVVFRETVMEFIANKFDPDAINELQERLNALA